MDNREIQAVQSIDARGRSCPEPVLMTQRVLSSYKGGEIEVLVDAMVAVENIKRYATNQGFQVNVEERQEYHSLTIRK